MQNKIPFSQIIILNSHLSDFFLNLHFFSRQKTCSFVEVELKFLTEMNKTRSRIKYSGNTFAKFSTKSITFFLVCP